MKKNKSKRFFRILLIVVSVCSLWFVPWKLVKGWIKPLPNTVQEQVNQAIDQGFDGMIVYVDKAGENPAFYAGGYNNRDKKTKADPSSLFKIASISKLYVAVAITKLIEDKGLSIDQSLAHYFPELKGRIENAEDITVKMMVQHRSGIPNFTDTPDFWANPPENGEKSLELVLDLPANFAPGQDYEYSNTNYLLLSMLIDKLAGYSHHQYIQEQILTPLNLQNTFFSNEEVNMERVMSGYHVDYPYDLKEDDQGMLATAKDVGTFLRALNEGTLLTKEEQSIYTSMYELEHSGWVPGYQSFAEYDSDLDAVIIKFYSTTDEKLIMWNLAEIINHRIADNLQNQYSEN